MLKTSSYAANFHFINQLQNCLIISPGSKCVYLIGNHLLTVIKLFFFSSQGCACVSPWSLIQQQTSPSWSQFMKVVSLCSGMLWLDKSWVEIPLMLNQVNHQSLVVLHIYKHATIVEFQVCASKSLKIWTLCSLTWVCIFSILLFFYRFPKLLTRRICLTIKSFFSCWSFP